MKKTYLLGCILFVTIIISLMVGRYEIHLGEVVDAFLLQGSAITQNVLFQIRLPRIIVVCLSGGALALSGMVYQTIFRNPLASGDVIGASSGCSLGAVIAILLFNQMFAIALFSFVGGIVLVLLALFLASKVRGNRILNLVVAGIVIQALANALLMMLKISADPFHELASIEYWLMGGFSNITWSQVWITLGMVVVCSVILYLLRWQIQMLSFGEEANTMGISTRKMQIIAIIVSTLLISSVISIAGMVSWVGLLVPHMIRMIHKQPFSKSVGTLFLAGSILLLICDTLARSLFPIELPISILTSLFGAIFLIVSFAKRRFPL